ncbi:MAG: SUMF1/EgtB/PvdO family nonheme iron enzyme [Magnetococcales bacterium]|nr:SUMF1/EgtB/PvdO family nonheme iron enzyme [Magnetococcales bacterium]MBF0321620.1 SUMF1/EgtB/PvdO family nonheme iron enzyme [Magnetococcales bacterium]
MPIQVDAFHMSRYPVTREQYWLAMQQGVVGSNPFMTAAPDYDQKCLPMTRVTFAEARAFAHWVGGELPSEVQWEYAAQGGKGHLFPWGNHPGTEGPIPVTHANLGSHHKGPLSVGSWPDGCTPHGVEDMCGNVFEWCLDWSFAGQKGSFFRTAGATHAQGAVKYCCDPHHACTARSYSQHTCCHPDDPSLHTTDGEGKFLMHCANPNTPDAPEVCRTSYNSGVFRVVKGGCYLSADRFASNKARASRNPWQRHADVGFRVVWNPVQEPEPNGLRDILMPDLELEPEPDPTDPPSSEYTHDVFLCHSHLDREAVHQLADKLKNSGLRVWIDVNSVEGGDPIIGRIMEGLQKSRVAILILSKHAIDSQWAKFERNVVMNRDPNNEHKRFVPIKLDDCEIPLELQHSLIIDYRNKSEEQYRKIISACRKK